MSDLTNIEKRKFERLLGMGSGYVLDFSNRTFDEFVRNTVGRNIYDSKYDGHGSSKAKMRLLQGQAVPDIEALAIISDEKDFELVARAVRDTIEKNEPETGLDRLHTFIIKYLRTLCRDRGLPVTRDKPLHSLFGEYVKAYREAA